MKIPSGFKISSANFGLDESDNKNFFIGSENDVAIIFGEDCFDVAATFTQNYFAAPPVHFSKKNLKISNQKTRAVFINTVFANAGTGKIGEKSCQKIADYLSQNLKISNEKILLFSTGKIGTQLPMKKFSDGIPKICQNFDNNINNFGRAILTTDLVEKIVFTEFSSGAKILGFSKGSGMIAPNMATMLGFFLTDAKIDRNKMTENWKKIINKSLNCVCVDNCESTNDAAVLLSSQKIEVDEEVFWENLEKLTIDSTKKIAADGEGATKLISVLVCGSDSEISAQKIAKKIISYDLLKCAIYGQDPNFGRILAAAGSAGVKFDPEKIKLFLDGEKIFENGLPIQFDHQKIFQNSEVKIKIDLCNGKYSAESWGCDLTEKYVQINGKYST